MRKFKKNLFAVIAAVSLVANTGYVANTTDVYAKEVAKTDLSEQYVYNPANGIVKFTNKPVELALRYFDPYLGDDEGEEVLLENGVDYDVLGYLTLGVDENSYGVSEFDESDVANLTKGLPKEKGDYAIFIEGKGNYKGSTVVQIRIIDPKSLSDAQVPEYNEVISYKEIEISFEYYDSETDEVIYGNSLKEDVDYTYVGWIKDTDDIEDYSTVSNWNSGDPTENDTTYVFKFVGKGEYTGELYATFGLADLMNVENYSFSFAFRYNAQKKAYERYVYCPYLDNKNYKVSYCDAEEYDNNPEEPTWIEGLPEKKGFYAVAIEGIGQYIGLTVYSFNCTNDIFVLDGEKVTIKDAKFYNDCFVVICPTETKEYEISSSNMTTGHAYGMLFDEYYNFIDENYGDENTDYFTIKQTLEAGKLYVLYIDACAEYESTEDKYSIDISIKGGYKYNAPAANEEVKDEPKNDTPKVEDKKEEFNAPKVGSVITDKQYKYTVKKAVTKKGEIGEVELAGFKKKESKKIKVADKVTIDGNTYKVTSIAKNAFKGSKKVTSVVIGKNVAVIGAGAFANIAKLKKVTIKSEKLTKIGAKAFNKKKGKKVTIKVPKDKKKDYKKLIKKAKIKKVKVK